MSLANIRNAALAMAGSLVAGGCTSIMEVDARRSFAPPPTLLTLSLPGGPSNDNTYSVSTSRASIPSNMNFLSPSPLPGGTPVIALPETQHLMVSGRRAGISTNVTWSESHRLDRIAQQHWFRSTNFDLNADVALRVEVRFRHAPGSAGPIVRPRTTRAATIDESSPPMLIEWVAGPTVGPVSPIPDEGAALMTIALDGVGGECVRAQVTTAADRSRSLVFSAPIFSPIEIRATAFRKAISVVAVGARLAELDPDGPPDGWRTACSAQLSAEPVELGFTAESEREDVIRDIVGNAGRAWSALVATPASSSAQAIYDVDAAPGELTANDFEFVRDLRATFLESAQIWANSR